MWLRWISLSLRHLAVLSLRSFAHRRLEFSQMLSLNSTFTVSRYFRLMGLAMTEICATTPLAVFIIWLNATAAPIGPWRSWEDTHYNFSRIEQIPAVLWRQNQLTVISIELSRWLNPLCSFTFFAFFGFAHESLKNYRLAWNWFTQKLGLASPTSRHIFKSSKQSIQSPLKGRMSTSIPTFSVPLHSLDRTNANNSTLSNITIDKDSYIDSEPFTPLSSTACSASPTKTTHIISPVLSESPQKIDLTRSRTL